jgi:hypothetical protein
MAQPTRAEQRYHLTLEQHADVVTLISDSKDDIERHVDLKLNSLKWQMVSALLGGQVLAGTVAAVITRTTPADAGRVALRAIEALI